ncbi:unnamed protein product [Callosobruchus maculatus]|uniref:Uncharacterized protein n=1 Tax=Callosobruchus maculatus TaxID=64391 RepID=A0A653BUR7_CALMS|nr:unnamed protein product [Callosobruchus maculatus]
MFYNSNRLQFKSKTDSLISSQIPTSLGFHRSYFSFFVNKYSSCDISTFMIRFYLYDIAICVSVLRKISM